VNHSKRNLKFILTTLFFMWLVIGCGGKKPPPPPPPPPPPKPVTATLSASPATIEAGQSSTLTWSTENADDVTLNGTKVNPSGSQSVSPAQTTTYNLSATGKGGTQQAQATVTVSQPPPPPPPPPPPSLTEQQLFDQNVTDVYFDYDKYDLRPEAQQTLTHAAQTISQHPNWKVRIEGSCDDRGSTEYNLTLGEDRANAAKQFLIKSGVNTDQLQTISYGKEKPVCTEATEDCWQKNRHDHFVLLH
jgi:peptidoglycan-associated lipoprotein